MDKKQKDFSIGYFILALALMFVSQYFLFTQSLETLSYSQFKSLLKHGQITDIVVRDKEISGAIKPEALKEIFTPQKITTLGDRAKKFVPFHVVRVEDPHLTAELSKSKKEGDPATRRSAKIPV